MNFTKFLFIAIAVIALGIACFVVFCNMTGNEDLLPDFMQDAQSETTVAAPTAG